MHYTIENKIMSKMYLEKRFREDLNLKYLIDWSNCSNASKNLAPLTAIFLQKEDEFDIT